MKTPEEILREINQKEKVKLWMYEVLSSKHNYKDFQEAKQGIDLVSSYISGLEFSLSLTRVGAE